jgi:hypothetical protein
MGGERAQVLRGRWDRCTGDGGSSGRAQRRRRSPGCSSGGSFGRCLTRDPRPGFSQRWRRAGRYRILSRMGQERSRCFCRSAGRRSYACRCRGRKNLTRNRLSEKCRSNCRGQQNQRQHKPLPACQHIRAPGTVENDFTRPLNRPDSRSPGQQRARRQEGNEEDDDHFGAHKRRDYIAG